MTNLSVSEKLALEEVFECLKDTHCQKMNFNRRIFSHRIMKLFMMARRKFLHVKR